jgi:ABC-type multidrug transport system permease subunit
MSVYLQAWVILIAIAIIFFLIGVAIYWFQGSNDIPSTWVWVTLTISLIFVIASGFMYLVMRSRKCGPVVVENICAPILCQKPVECDSFYPPC